MSVIALINSSQPWRIFTVETSFKYARYYLVASNVALLTFSYDHASIKNDTTLKKNAEVYVPPVKAAD